MASQTSPARINYRSVRERTLEDQIYAAEEGYNSVMELAFDEMLQALVMLQDRVDKLEAVTGSANMTLDERGKVIKREQWPDPED